MEKKVEKLISFVRTVKPKFVILDSNTWDELEKLFEKELKKKNWPTNFVDKEYWNKGYENFVCKMIPICRDNE